MHVSSHKLSHNNSYFQHIYVTFCGSLTLITNNGKGFKNELFQIVASELDIKCHFLSPNNPQLNETLENLYSFLNPVFANKSMINWNGKILYNFYYLILESSQACIPVFCLILDRDTITPLRKLFSAAIRYQGNDKCLFDLESMRYSLGYPRKNISISRHR